MRDGVVVHDGKLSSLRRFKDDVKSVAAGFECGIGLEDFNDIKEGDIIEAYQKREIPRQTTGGRTCHPDPGGTVKFFVGIGRYQIDMVSCSSLKDKRRFVKSITDRLGNSKLIGVCEVGSR